MRGLISPRWLSGDEQIHYAGLGLLAAGECSAAMEVVEEAWDQGYANGCADTAGCTVPRRRYVGSSPEMAA